jgi:hypothetical protein
MLRQMNTLSVRAETAGNAYTPQGDGIQITNTSRAVSLFITQPNSERFTTDECYEFSSCLCPILLSCSTKILSKTASNDFK